MKTLERRALTALHLVVGVTGFAYLYMQHFVEPDDPFAIVNHPAQPMLLTVHVVAAPAFILFFGMIFRHHVWRKLHSPNPRGWGTGFLAMIGFLTMALSAYLLQVATEPGTIRFLYWTHVGSGSVFALAYTIHFAIGWPVGRARRALRKAVERGEHSGQ